MTISKKFAKILRKKSTEPEKILWHYLRNRRFLGYKFRRQFIIGNYIADFICLEENLVIELDGAEHLESQALKYDKLRTGSLNQRGLRVIRFYNNDILNNIDKVLESLRQELVSPSSGFQPPSPLKGEGLGGANRDQDSFTPKGEGLGGANQEQDSFTLKGEGLGGSVTNKRQLRQWAKDVRSKLDTEVLSKVLVEKLKQTNEYKNANNIMIFYPLKDEVDLLELLEDKTKTFYLPKIDGDNLLCCRFDKDTGLCESCFRTMEPNSPAAKKSKIDLVVVPALAVDKNNCRLGYGKGFYDRFLSQFNPPLKTIVCIPKELIVETIFPNEYDIPVDLVITD